MLLPPRVHRFIPKMGTIRPTAQLPARALAIRRTLGRGGNNSIGIEDQPIADVLLVAAEPHPIDDEHCSLTRGHGDKVDVEVYVFDLGARLLPVRAECGLAGQAGRADVFFGERTVERAVLGEMTKDRLDVTTITAGDEALRERLRCFFGRRYLHVDDYERDLPYGSTPPASPHPDRLLFIVPGSTSDEGWGIGSRLGGIPSHRRRFVP